VKRASGDNIHNTTTHKAIHLMLWFHPIGPPIPVKDTPATSKKYMSLALEQMCYCHRLGTRNNQPALSFWSILSSRREVQERRCSRQVVDLEQRCCESEASRRPRSTRNCGRGDDDIRVAATVLGEECVRLRTMRNSSVAQVIIGGRTDNTESKLAGL
jgi:hypothetical protein